MNEKGYTEWAITLLLSLLGILIKSVISKLLDGHILTVKEKVIDSLQKVGYLKK